MSYPADSVGRFVLRFYSVIIFICAPTICVYSFEGIKDFRNIHPIFHLLIPLLLIILFGYQEFRLFSLLFTDLFTEQSESSGKEEKNPIYSLPSTLSQNNPENQEKGGENSCRK